ncbi:MAG: hypothetical protein ACF8NJ_00510 [Phycisphaerales bacterium JB038]
MSHLFSKLLTAILALTLIGLGLLIIRQDRYLAAAQLTQHHRALQQAQRQVWDLQAELARRVTPEHLRELAERHGLNAPRSGLLGAAPSAPAASDPLTEPAPVSEVAAAPTVHPGAGLALVALSEAETEEEEEDE